MRRIVRDLLGCAAALTVIGVHPAWADDARDISDLSRLSIEELSQLEVTSVSKRPEQIGQAASSVYVITNDDLRRTGVTSIPEALRLAPNLEVARIDALDYTITARGSGGFEAAEKLLVLIDGRSVYTPLYGGVDWDQHHVLLDDVDRIEVISGPGGALWGANAVNGVINITSRKAQDTQGLLASITGGSGDADLRLRYGGPLGDSAAFRVYATAYQRDDLRKANGDSAKDGWDGVQVGFRADWSGARDTFTLQGDVHDNSIDESQGVADGYVRGGNVVGRWTRTLGGGGTVEVQAYYDRVERAARLVFDSLDTWDLQVQQALAPMGRHELVWGAGYRVTQDDFHLLGFLTGIKLLDPESRRTSIGNLFAQDQITLREDLTLTLGLKLENNSYTELEYLPNVRLAWQVNDRQMVWGAISRAVRNPSRVERDFSVPGVVDPGHFGSEKLVAYEAGYRGRIGERATASVTLYYDDYDELRTNDASAVPGMPAYVGNTMEGRTIGIEAWADYDVSERWRVSAGFSAIDKEYRLKPGSLDTAKFESAGVDPPQWLKVRSQFQISDTVDLDVRLRAYAEVPTLAASGYLGADAYVTADVKLAWRIRPDLELSLVGNNLLQEQHAEASEDRRSEVPRTASVGLRWTR